MTEQTIVVVEDDAAIADLLDMYLRDAGYRPLLAATGRRGLELIRQHQPDLAVLDIGLPDIDGFEVCREVRSRSNLPVLFLSARDSELDRLLGLELGADDYVAKPFSPREVIARIRAILRRGALVNLATATAQVIDIGEGIAVDLVRREATVTSQNSTEIASLATKEFDLLAFFARNQGIALSRQQLLDGVWGDGWIGDDRTVDVHVRQLRKKLGDGLPLATVWGIGYRLG